MVERCACNISYARETRIPPDVYGHDTKIVIIIRFLFNMAHNNVFVHNTILRLETIYLFVCTAELVFVNPDGTVYVFMFVISYLIYLKKKKKKYIYPTR